MGIIEVDETYIGGKEGNKHSDKKLRAGRGTVGKTPVVGIKDRDTNRIDAQVVISTDAPTLTGFVHQRTTDKTMVFTDEAKAYNHSTSCMKASSIASENLCEVKCTLTVSSLSGLCRNEAISASITT